jgi:L-threonylcarbamoyladenylate synthase
MFNNMIEIKDAAHKLKDGFLVAFPTETVYGLGADATNQESVSRIFEIKNRPNDHPLIVHLASINQLPDWAIDIPKYAQDLAQAFWPGPMTLILRRNKIAKDFVTGGQETIGIRIPNHEIALSLLEEFRKIGSGAIAAPSANKFGKVSPTSFEHVQSEIGKDLTQDDLIIDGGNSLVGIESTIIDCTGNLPKVLRPGAISDKMIQDITGKLLSNHASNIRVSGSFSSHYAPSAKVVLDVEPQRGDGFIALAQFETPSGVTRLSSPKTVEEFAQELYSAFHLGDQMNLSRIVVISPTGDDLALAIRDRLLKASNEE